MPVPDYQTLMLPLRLTEDQQVHKMVDVFEPLAKEFNLSPEERAELLQSGQNTLANRAGWARSYLKAAGLLDSAGRGAFRITQRGLDVLAKPPKRIDNKFLDQFPEFVEFRQGTKEGNSADSAVPEMTQTPEDVLDASYRQIRKTLAQELLQGIAAMPPQFFEKLVVDLLLAMGYGGSRSDAGQVIGRSGDGGVDGLINEDRLGLDIIYVQAKRWKETVGRPTVQAFAGSLEGHRARKGVMMSTSTFSAEALEYVQRIEKRIVLIGGDRLTQLMIEHGIGVAEVATYSIKRIDSDYFGDVG